jgi:hypothetical protein
MLKELSLSAKKELLKGYNQVWEGDSFPEEWTKALVVPVLKPGKDASRVACYRLISLTSCVCKLFEKMVNNSLLHTLVSQGVILEQQYGFRRNRSTIDVHIILESTHSKWRVDLTRSAVGVRVDFTRLRVDSAMKICVTNQHACVSIRHALRVVKKTTTKKKLSTGWCLQI